VGFQLKFDAPMEENFSFMKRMAIKGLQYKGVYDDPWYQEHLEEECEVIKKTGVEDFFLQTAYICALIDSKGIFRGPARGSCLASVVCYGLNITKIPPKPYKLSFARFLNETRAMTQLPDIDTDVSSDQRDEVLKLIINEFGEDRCSQVVTRLPYSAKMAIKDLAKMIDVPFAEVNRITASLTDDEDYHQNEKVMNFLNQYPFIRDGIDDFVGLLKAHGKHPGAVIIFDKPLWNYTSVLKVKDSMVICNSGVECEAQGFLKNDTLSVKVLDIQRDCLKLLDDPDVELPYNFDDPKVFETICRDPLGIFQLEKAAGRQGIKMVQPSNFNEMVATISLIRPGARNSGMDKLYADYKFGRQEPIYLDPRLKDILADTQGLMIFQEDIMAVARELAGMSDLETDHLRRAVSKKKKEAFTEFKPKFIQGCLNNNVNEDVAEELWSNIEKSSDYSFNRSHAVGYAALGYQSAWLKTYYPLEFSIAMLMHVKDDEKRIEILQSIKESNVELCCPDINKSEFNTAVVDGKIYMGFDLIDKVSIKSSEAILEEREKNGLFTSFDDFCSRVAPRKANKRVKENLIWAGAFDNIPITDKNEEKV
jgi:DNA polymerase-3 subunit alpha